jgi:hypothetical protein
MLYPKKLCLPAAPLQASNPRAIKNQAKIAASTKKPR